MTIQSESKWVIAHSNNKTKLRNDEIKFIIPIFPKIRELESQVQLQIKNIVQYRRNLDDTIADMEKKLKKNSEKNYESDIQKYKQNLDSLSSSIDLLEYIKTNLNKVKKITEITDIFTISIILMKRIRTTLVPIIEGIEISIGYMIELLSIILIDVSIMENKTIDFRDANYKVMMLRF